MKSILSLLLMSLIPTLGFSLSYDQDQDDEDTVEKIKVLSNLNQPQKLFMSAVKEGKEDNFKTVIEMAGILAKINKKLENDGFPRVEFNLSGTTKYFKGLKSKLKKKRFYDDIEEDLVFMKTPTDDRWMQDWGEFVLFENPYGEEEVGIYYVNRKRGLKKVVKEISEREDLAYIESATKEAVSGDYGGNIEGTPDGVVYIGSNMSKAQKEDFRDLGNSNNMVELDVDFLAVGHVDEILNVIPYRGRGLFRRGYDGPKVNYAFMNADPLLAMTMILNYKGKRKFLNSKNPKSEDHGIDGYLNRIHLKTLKKTIVKYLKFEFSETDYYEIGKNDFEEKDLKKCAKKKNPEAKYCRFIANQLEVDKIIKSNMSLLKRKTPIIDDHFVAVPQFFNCGKGVTECLSFLPGTVNSVVLGNNIIIPDTYFPYFNRYIQTTLNDALPGYEGEKHVYFVKEFREYHDLMGEIHCGTNVLRDPYLYFSH